MNSRAAACAARRGSSHFRPPQHTCMHVPEAALVHVCLATACRVPFCAGPARVRTWCMPAATGWAHHGHQRAHLSQCEPAMCGRGRHVCAEQHRRAAHTAPGAGPLAAAAAVAGVAARHRRQRRGRLAGAGARRTGAGVGAAVPARAAAGVCRCMRHGCVQGHG
jgi:hypothetical protein